MSAWRIQLNYLEFTFFYYLNFLFYLRTVENPVGIIVMGQHWAEEVKGQLIPIALSQP